MEPPRAAVTVVADTLPDKPFSGTANEQEGSVDTVAHALPLLDGVVEPATTRRQ